jgi:hypothetical protein
MIKSTELRIGNLIIWNPKLTNLSTTLPPAQVEVASVQEDQISYISPRVEQRVEPFEDDLLPLDAPLSPLEEFEPLLLTAAIVEKCGFKYSEGDHRYTAYLKEPLAIIFKADNSILVRLDHREFPYQYLHQLQNLYFALTGEEISVTLD